MAETIRAPRCAYRAACGGCTYQECTYEEQVAKKQQYVESLLRPLCGVVHPMLHMAEVAPDGPFHYRNKVHAAFGRLRDGTVTAGIYRENSHQIVPVSDCMLENRVGTAIARDFRELAQSFRIPIYDEDRQTGVLRHILIRCSRDGKALVVPVVATPVVPGSRQLVQALRRMHPEIVSVVLNVNDRRTSMVLGKRNIVLYGDGYLEDTLCGMRFRLSPTAFYQVNPIQTERLYQKAIELAALTPASYVIDAYCGIGTVGLIAAPHVRHVTGVELSDAAVRDAIGNARRSGVRNATFYQGDAGAFLTAAAKEGMHADAVFLDPPRSGSSPEFLQALLAMRPDRIVYISCNPETLARDLRVLQGEYRAEEAWPVDMFPWTAHVETVVCLSQQKAGRTYPR